MAFNSDLKSHTPEELPADNEVAEAPRNEQPGSGEKSKAVISNSGAVDRNPAVLDPEQGGAPLPDVEYEQILQELRQTKTEQAVADRRNHKLNLDKVTFGITGVIAIAFVIWGFMGRDSLSETSTSVLNWVMEYT
ncbi:BCCT family transporter, partial [Arthrobacter sp. NPDC093128]